MRIFLVSLLAFGTLSAEIEVNGHIDLDMQAHLVKPEDKNKNSITAKQTLEVNYSKDDLTIFSKLYAQEAYYDLTDLTKDKKTDRTFARVDELYLKYDFENDAIKAGKSIEFWGALEVRNIVDGFNPTDFRNDFYAKDKYGVYNLQYSHYTESGEFCVVAKLYEQEQPMADYPYVYNFFLEFVTYDGTLNSEESKYRPSVYLKYSGSTDTEYALDYAFIYENGYDSQRHFTTPSPENLSPLSPTFGQPTTFIQETYIVNKIMTYNTLVVNSTLIKLEALYAKVDENPFVGDYSHIGLGVEHTLENLYESAALGLIAEYYRYDTFEDDKDTDIELFETMQNDLFIGARYSFNNANDSSFIGGGIFDLEYDEQSYYLKFESRAWDSYKISMEYDLIIPSETDLTAYALLGKHERLAINIAYHF